MVYHAPAPNNMCVKKYTSYRDMKDLIFTIVSLSNTKWNF